jgi:hypothetical protein
MSACIFLCDCVVSLTESIYVGFEVLTVVVMKSYIFWDITPCSLLKVNQCFGGTCRVHVQGFDGLFTRQRWRWHAPPKHRLTFSGLRDICQKIELFQSICIWMFVILCLWAICVCVYLFLLVIFCLYQCIFVCLGVCLSVSVCAFQYVSVCLSEPVLVPLCVCFFFSFCLCISLWLCLCIFIFIYLCECISACLPVSPPVFVFVYVCIFSCLFLSSDHLSVAESMSVHLSFSLL